MSGSRRAYSNDESNAGEEMMAILIKVMVIPIVISMNILTVMMMTLRVATTTMVVMMATNHGSTMDCSVVGTIMILPTLPKEVL